jgi:glycosyltransferase involved in cell wall biosynthesis
VKLSVVVATYNRRALLSRVVAEMAKQTLPREQWELMVVDDGSTDGTESVGAELAKGQGVRYIRQGNRGASAARNRGIREATGDVVVFTDDDCLVPPEWLERLAEGYARHPEVVGVGGGIVPEPAALRASAVARYELQISTGVYGAGEREVLGAFECPAGGTNNMSYRREVLESVGGFDEGFPPRVWGEDADLKWRITQRGGRLLYLPVFVVHVRSYSVRSFVRQSVERGRGEAHFWLKHEGRRPWGSALRRLALAPAQLLAAPVRRDPAMRAVSALGSAATAWGCLTYGGRRESHG